jgi:hypothetical protein
VAWDVKLWVRMDISRADILRRAERPRSYLFLEIDPPLATSITLLVMNEGVDAERAANNGASVVRPACMRVPMRELATRIANKIIPI